jgi:hypothetical protein
MCVYCVCVYTGVQVYGRRTWSNIFVYVCVGVGVGVGVGVRAAHMEPMGRLLFGVFESGLPSLGAEEREAW